MQNFCVLLLLQPLSITAAPTAEDKHFHDIYGTSLGVRSNSWSGNSFGGGFSAAIYGEEDNDPTSPVNAIGQVHIDVRDGGLQVKGEMRWTEGIHHFRVHESPPHQPGHCHSIGRALELNSVVGVTAPINAQIEQKLIEGLVRCNKERHCIIDSFLYLPITVENNIHDRAIVIQDKDGKIACGHIEPNSRSRTRLIEERRKAIEAEQHQLMNDFVTRDAARDGRNFYVHGQRWRPGNKANARPSLPQYAEPWLRQARIAEQAPPTELQILGPLDQRYHAYAPQSTAVFYSHRNQIPPPSLPKTNKLPTSRYEAMEAEARRQARRQTAPHTPRDYLLPPDPMRPYGSGRDSIQSYQPSGLPLASHIFNPFDEPKLPPPLREYASRDPPRALPSIARRRQTVPLPQAELIEPRSPQFPGLKRNTFYNFE